MLSLNCLICAELFTGTDNVHATVCGHMFHHVCISLWLRSSETCPQCRNQCNRKNLFRLYFNVVNSDAANIDNGSQEQLDNSDVQLQIQQIQLTKAAEMMKVQDDSMKNYRLLIKDTLDKLDTEMRATDELRKEVLSLKHKLEMIEFYEAKKHNAEAEVADDLLAEVQSLKKQLRMLELHELKSQEMETKIIDDLRKEVQALKKQLEMAKSIDCILSASNAETGKLLKTENDPKKLKILITTLKRELRNCETKQTDKSNFLRVVQSNLRREIERNKSLEKQVTELKNERNQLTEKLKTLEQSMPSTSKSGGRIMSTNAKANSNHLGVKKHCTWDSKKCKIFFLNGLIKKKIKKSL